MPPAPIRRTHFVAGRALPIGGRPGEAPRRLGVRPDFPSSGPSSTIPACGPSSSSTRAPEAGAPPRASAEVRALLERRLGPVDVRARSAPGHAIELAREAARGGRALVVAVGGDGTLHEVANGDPRRGRRRGRSATSASERGVTSGARWASSTASTRTSRPSRADASCARRRRQAALPRAGRRRGVALVRQRRCRRAWAASSTGTSRDHEGPRRQGGVLPRQHARARRRAERGRLRCGVTLGDDGHERRVDTFMFAICNGRYFGSGMHVAPMAKPDDGRFEVVSMDAPSKLAFAAYSRRIYDGSHLSTPGVQHFGCDRLALDLENEARPRRIPPRRRRRAARRPAARRRARPESPHRAGACPRRGDHFVRRRGGDRPALPQAAAMGVPRKRSSSGISSVSCSRSAAMSRSRAARFS